jgi:hypothetical protein
VKRDSHFGRNDARHCGFAETWRPSQQNMVCGLTSLFGSSEHDVEMLLQFTLSDEIIKQAGT